MSQGTQPGFRAGPALPRPASLGSFHSSLCRSAGLVDWPALLPELFTRFMWAFEVPVGAASGTPPFCESGGRRAGRQAFLAAEDGRLLSMRCPAWNFAVMLHHTASCFGMWLPALDGSRLPRLMHPLDRHPLGLPAAFPAPGLCQLLFHSEQKSRSSCIAKATIYLLGRAGSQGAGQLEDPGVLCWGPGLGVGGWVGCGRGGIPGWL